MPDAFRKLKHTLRKDHLDKQPNLEAKMMAIPNGIRKEDWEQFCINEVDDKQLKRRAMAVESRKHSVYGHTGGRKSSAMVEYEMKAKREDPTIPITRTQVWIETHTRKDRTTLPTAEPFMKLVKEKLAESTQSESDNNSVHPLSIDNDPLTQVFGKKVKGLPGVGSFVSKRKYDATLHAHIMYTEEKGEREGLKKKVDEMQTKVNFIFDYCKSQIGGPPATIPQSTGGSSTHVPMPHAGGSSSPIPMSQADGTSTPVLQQLQATIGKSIPMPPMMINNARGPSLGEREKDSTTSASIEPTPTARLCELFDWNWNCVAVAKEVVDPIHRGNCHNYQLDPQYEMKVSMSVRKIFFAKLYKETPDAKTIKEVGVGEFFVWPKSHIKFMEALI
ncbi:uncharacterized protein M6B38_163125 [Iris pallida]|uniref:Transposase Tnp1/En/Spm-like domain-containing protein n=1 Tax=Iris pallida TaxID=29817 RepID=A0AAX6F195_IRIPA|nr:uncharacterized protein M6B38_163125 [Iris pallida]